MKQFSQDMVFEKSTKGTHVYKAVVPASARVTTLYVNKDAFQGEPAPKKIRLTIDEQT